MNLLIWVVIVLVAKTTWATATQPYVLFMTTATTNGIIPDPDALCETEAATRNLVVGGSSYNFAIHSKSAKLFNDTFFDRASTRNVVGPTGAVITTADDFVRGILQVNLTAAGVCTDTNAEYWTGMSTRDNGEYEVGEFLEILGATCLDWTSNAVSPTVGKVGSCLKSTTWANKVNRGCNLLFPLLCVHSGSTVSPTNSPTLMPTLTPTLAPTTPAPTVARQSLTAGSWVWISVVLGWAGLVCTWVLLMMIIKG